MESELGQQFTHVLRPATRGGLIGHRRHPFDQILLEKAAQSHQHAGNRTVPADKVSDTFRQTFIDHLAVDRIENDQCIVIHAQLGSGIDPVTVPAGRTQFREHVRRIIAALAGYQDIAFFQFIDTKSIFQDSFVFRHRRCHASDIRRSEENGFEQIKIVFFLHALHQHGTDHAPPAYQSYQFHLLYPIQSISKRLTVPRLRHRPFLSFRHASYRLHKCRLYAIRQPGLS